MLVWCVESAMLWYAMSFHILLYDGMRYHTIIIYTILISAML